MRTTWLISSVYIAVLAVSPLQGEELLVSGDFETPGGFDIPGWTLNEFVSETGVVFNTAQTSGAGFSGETGDGGIWFRPDRGGRPLRQPQGNFDDDNLPAGDVDGVDFLTVQRGIGSGTTPAEGDANADGVVDQTDINTWRDNFGDTSRLVSAVLSQVAPATPGTTYVFKGASRWENNYSGGVETLDAEGPFGAINSPTSTTFEMDFLDANGDVIGNETLDLKTEQLNINFWLEHTPLQGTAPAGTTNVRVSAAARDMAWNGIIEDGNNQAAFVDHFSLTTVGDPTELLVNPDLDDDVPDAIDFWNPIEVPEERTDIMRTEPQFGFANHTPGGTRGGWVSAFFGAHENFEPDPVDAIISQTVAIVPGATYTFSGWMKFEQNYSGGVDTISSTGGTGSPGFLAGQESPTQTLIKLAFLDAGGDVISEEVIDVKEAREAACGGNANDRFCGPSGDGWVQHSLTGVAPANAVEARLSAEMLDMVYNANPQQSMFFDDFSLDGPVPGQVAAVPEPATLVSLSIALTALASGRRSPRRS